ncbi:MAG: response regulator transcription factor [Candidatus Obscuribacterales bacterium]|nr:response regulator transcription factor [Candidatus Obscuribacterales bacterium]
MINCRKTDGRFIAGAAAYQVTYSGHGGRIDPYGFHWHNMAKVLLVEDDPAVADTVCEFLRNEHHQVEVVHNGDEGFDMLKHYSFDLAILDWQLPGLAGVEICRGYRTRGGKIPILMLTGQSTIDHKEQGLDAGADDYLTKPFNIRELAARVRALLRRPSDVVQPLVAGSEISLDYRNFTLVRNGQKTKLLPKEFALIEFLLRHPGQFFTPEKLLNHVWESDSEATVGALRTCVKRLRTRIDTKGEPSLIQSHRGYGYKIDIG